MQLKDSLDRLRIERGYDCLQGAGHDASLHPTDRVAYTAGKEEFVAEIVRRIGDSPR